jgi:hypothetical protein
MVSQSSKNMILYTFIPWAVLASLLIMLIATWSLLATGGMVRVTAWYLLMLLGIPSVLLFIITSGIFVYNLVRYHHVAVVTVLLLVLSLVAAWPGLWNLGLLTIAFPASLEKSTPSAEIRLPADTPLLVAWGGQRLETNQHANMPDQRWAYDLLAEPAFNGSSRLEDYGCYGLSVLAPADGEVSAVRDGAEDHTPGTLSNDSTTPFGNHVILKLEKTGTYLVLAHLQKGSVAVRSGQFVHEGDLLGKCGNSGNTSEPHIHIHHQRQKPDEATLGFAEGLPLYFRDIEGPSMPEGGFRVENNRAIPLGPVLKPIVKK